MELVKKLRALFEIGPVSFWLGLNVHEFAVLKFSIMEDSGYGWTIFGVTILWFGFSIYYER